MYSPKIDDEVIPVLYRLSKALGKPMTKVVNGIIKKALLDVEVRKLPVKKEDGQDTEKYVVNKPFII